MWLKFIFASTLAHNKLSRQVEFVNSCFGFKY